MSTAASGRAYSGPALFSFGFRPFFLFAALWAAVAVPLWLLGMGGVETFAGFDRDWHVHEMLFGYLAGVVAGFLLTAVPNWTGRMPVMGGPLAALFALWVAGRLAMLFATSLGPVAAAIDSLFLIAFAAVVWREVIAGRNWRNLAVCAIVTLLALANMAFHARGLWIEAAPVAERTAMAAAAVLIALIGGRITPSFTRNWLMQSGIRPRAPAWPRLDPVGLALAAAGALSWVLFPQAMLSGVLLAAAGLLAWARLSRWEGEKTAREPLVWSLHAGYAWLGLGLLLIGLSILFPAAVPRTAGVHALTAGAVGAMTLAVMTRASLGHTGRARTADRATQAIYLAVNAAALFRVAAAFVPEAYAALLGLSAVFWSAAFGGFAVAYGPMLVQPRRVQVAAGAAS